MADIIGIFIFFSKLTFRAFLSSELTWYTANDDGTVAPVSLSCSIEWCDKLKEGNQKCENFFCVNIL